ncbi:MAG: S-layer homology domain-containing protein, partial [Acidimicrobiia bacterium]|nr:S-layer homology domain-containing protein [Acidimicrobiia bacterium]
CAIRTDQTIVCWGTDTNDRLDAPAGTYTTLATRNATTCAISTDGDLHCWGGTSNSATALHTPPAGTYTAVVVGGTYACAVATNGELDCWGSVGPGEPPAAPAGGFVDVVGSNQHACALATVGSVHCWGADHEGRSSPFPGTYDQIAGAHGSRTCARRVDGVGSCWGTIVVSGDPYVVQVDESPDLPDLAVWPGVIGDSGPVSLQVLGVSVELVSRVSLVRGGGHEHVAEAVLDGGVARTEARLVLDSIDQGSWDVLVQMADGSVVLIEDAVQVEEATGYDLYVRLSAPPMTRATFPSMVTVSVGNLGNTDARVVPVYLAGIPEAATLTGRFDLAELPAEPVPGLDGRLLPLDAVPVMVPDDRGTAMAPILVSNVPANSEVSFSMLVTVPEAGAPGGVPEFELSAWANACLGDLDLSLPETSDAADMAGAAGADRRSLAEIDALAECIVDGLALAVDVGLEFIPGGGCVKGGFGQFTKSQVAGAAAGATFNAMEQARTGEAVWGSWATTTIGSAVVDCAADIFPYTKALKVAKTVVTWGNRIIAGAELANDIAGGCMPETVAVPRTVTVMGAFDPNEKVGPPGVGEEGYTTPDVPFGYTIYFENDPEATAPALIVEITDEIDTTVFDPDTIRLGLITLSDELVITPPQGVREWSTTVDDPGSDDLIDIDVTWHDDTSELVWTMTAVDPDTGELPTDPLAGFLPPNVEPIEGEGSVSFVIEPRERTDGIVLSNAASIVFDNNEPIVTDAWVNTLDGTPPVGSVDPLPEVSTTTDLEVSWSAEDELSGVGGYQLLVSVDDGPLVTWFSVDDPTRTTATYEAERGRSYGFAVRAWDRAGNLEAVPVEPQAVTAVAPSLCFDDDGDGPFPDVGTSHPFCEAIEWLADEQITGGYGDGTFRPVAPISRQAMAAFLWRMAGSPEMSVDGDGPFPDVGLEHPFAEAIAWLADEGITGGYEDGTFRPVAPISRQAMAAFLWRMAGSPEMSVAGDGPFPDVGAGHPFAEAIAWLADEGITGGYDDGTFRPLEPISRQAMAAFLWRRAGFG